jgi:hypothetical protein
MLFPWLATLLSVGTAFLLPRLGEVWSRRWARPFVRLARRPFLSPALVGGTALATAVAFSLAARTVPRIHDEFSYLLGADTFAHGRLTNPPHPLWIHFETFHVIHQPTYASKYPPGQGLVLAAGQVLVGSPLAGVWLSWALACASLCWMLRAWIRPRWALLGGMLAALHFPLVPYWGTTYMGGAVALLGGALVLGALRRLLRRPRVASALLLAVGLASLANSRPYEGLILSAPVLAVLAVWFFSGQGPPLGLVLTRVVVPAALVLGAAAAAMAFYDYRVTHNPLRLPYQVHEDTYAAYPLFVFESPRPVPAYRHPVMFAFHTGWALRPYTASRSLAGLATLCGTKGLVLWATLVGPPLTLPLLALPWVVRDRWMALAALVLVWTLAAELAVVWLQPAYVAPALPLFFLLVVQGLRHLRLLRLRRPPVGRCLVRLLLLAFVFAFLLGLLESGWRADPADWAHTRAGILSELRNTGEKHLVLVRYRPNHDPLNEWVYNEADIDASPVVWAREMTPAEDAELLSYFRDRHVWLLDADAKPPRLRPYSAVGEEGRPGASPSR